MAQKKKNKSFSLGFRGKILYTYRDEDVDMYLLALLTPRWYKTLISYYVFLYVNIVNCLEREKIETWEGKSLVLDQRCTLLVR